jgi:hypothetical protein
MTKLPPEIRAHLHKTVSVTPAAIHEFVVASPAVQARVLAELRHQIADDSSATEIAFGATAFALIGLIIAPKQINLDGVDLLGGLAVGVILGFAAVAALIPLFWGAIVGGKKRARAAVWVAAYEDGLARSWALSGRSARRWQAERTPLVRVSR